MKQLCPVILLIALTVFLAACTGTADPSATPGPTNTAVSPIETLPPTETAVATDTVPTKTPPPLDTAAAPTGTPLPATETPTAEATAPPVTTLPIPTLDPSGSWSVVNPFYYLLGPTPAPEGWTVEPCEGEAALLCIADEQGSIGAAELLINPLDTNPEFQAFLEEQGITLDSAPEPGEAYDTAVRAALTAQAEQYFDIFEADRAFTYPNDLFTRLSPEPVLLGTLPGLAFGFTREDASGAIAERYLNLAAYDQGVLYWLTAPYDPANITTFASDEALIEFEPYLREIAAGLQLPPPVAETDVEVVNVVVDGVTLTAVYGQGLFGVGINVAASQEAPYAVTGTSPDGRWWQVVCPEVLSQVCWLPADPQRVEPVAP